MNLYRARQYAAFTLVEVLISIGIIVLLMGLLIPQIPVIKDQANRTRCTDHLHQLAMAVMHYSADKNEFPDREKWLRQDPAQGVRGGELYKYLGDERVYYCPSDTDLASHSMPALQSRLSSYKFNGWFNQRNPNTVSDTSLAVLFIEAATDEQGDSSPWFDPENPPALNNRHGGGAHIVYADAHTEFLMREKFSSDKATILRETRNTSSN